jgi:hypothetical protein
MILDTAPEILWQGLPKICKDDKKCQPILAESLPIDYSEVLVNSPNMSKTAEKQKNIPLKIGGLPTPIIRPEFYKATRLQHPMF